LCLVEGKMKAKHFSTLILIPFFLAHFCCSKADEQGTQWKGKIEYEDGVKVVKNPDEPVFGEIQFELEEDLILGSEKNEQDLFDKVFDVKVDRNGTIYVYDIRERKVRRISPDGEYMEDIGTVGQGPGEFQSPRAIWIDDRTGNLYVVDFLKIHVFDKQGIFTNVIHLQKMFTEIYVDSDGNIWAKGFDVNESGRFHIFDKISAKGEVLEEIASFPEMEGSETVGRKGDEVTVVSFEHGYEYKLFVSNVDDESFIYGYSKVYVLHKYDKSGNLLSKIVIEERPQGFTAKEKDIVLSNLGKKARDQVQLPKTKPFFKSIFSDSEGRIFVQRMPSPLSDPEIHEYDILSKEGYYIYRTTFPYKPLVIKNKNFYALVFDEETGLEFVKRFRIKNWKQIKAGI